MLGQRQAEEAIVPTAANEAENSGGKEEGEEENSVFQMKDLLWHGGSAWDAWFSCASNQVKPPSPPKFDRETAHNWPETTLNVTAYLFCRWLKCF